VTDLVIFLEEHARLDVPIPAVSRRVDDDRSRPVGRRRLVDVTRRGEVVRIHRHRRVHRDRLRPRRRTGHWHR